MLTETISLSSITVARIVAAVASLPGARFAGFTYQAKESGEVARHVVILGASYANCVRESLETLQINLPSYEGIDRQAAEELIASLSRTLLGFTTGEANPAYTKAETYEDVCPGIRMNVNDGTFEVTGLSHSKKILTAGVYKNVNSRPLTKAKDAIRRTLPVGRFRSYCLDAGCMESMRIAGKDIECF